MTRATIAELSDMVREETGGTFGVFEVRQIEGMREALATACVQAAWVGSLRKDRAALRSGIESLVEEFRAQKAYEVSDRLRELMKGM